MIIGDESWSCAAQRGGHRPCSPGGRPPVGLVASDPSAPVDLAASAPSVLKATMVERPIPGPDDVLVRIHAAGVCYHDVLSRGGKIPGSKPGRVLGHHRQVRVRPAAGDIVGLLAGVTPGDAAGVEA